MRSILTPSWPQPHTASQARPVVAEVWHRGAPRQTTAFVEQDKCRHAPIARLLARLSRCAPANRLHTGRMTLLETNLAPSGATTFPKALRVALDAPHGGRLIWRLQADGTVQVRLKYASAPPLASCVSPPSADHSLQNSKT